MSMPKDEAKKLIESLPEQATWDDIMYHFYVKKKILTGLKAADDGNVLTHEDVRKRVIKK